MYNIKSVLILCVFIFNGINTFSQTVNFHKTEANLVSAFKDFENTTYEDRYKNLSPKLKLKMKTILAHPESFQYPFDSLSEYIKIVTSPDHKVKLFSWDELTGGSWHDMTVLIQYKTDENQVKTQYIDTDNFDEDKGYTNAILHSLYTIEIDQKPYYLALGWGTYGGGQHHGDVLIFSIENGVFKNCSNCIEQKYSEIKASRGSKIDLIYNQKEKIISFNEFIYDENYGYYTPTQKKINLKLIGNSFKEIKN